MKKVLLIITTLLFISACSDDKDIAAPGDKQQSEAIRKMDFAQISRGGKLFQQNCAVCHGKQAEGSQNWQKMDDKGKFPPPPLNGSAHAWHHPMSVLVSTIKNGTAKIGGSMPAWKEKLSEQDIQDVIAWFQSKWPDEIYAAWYERDRLANQN